MKKYLRTHNQRGFDHVLLPIAFVVVFSVLGTAWYVIDHAAPWSGELQLSQNKSLCMDNFYGSKANGNKIDIWSCNNSQAQKWSINEVGSNHFTLKDGDGTCADDWGGKVGTGPRNRVYVKTNSCSTSNHAQVWEWNGAALENVYSHGCINTLNSRADGTALIVFSCKGNAGNEKWTEAAQKTSSSGSQGSGSSSSGSGSTSTAPAIPTAAPAGYTRAFTGTFNTPAPVGSFDSVYGSQYGEYTGCCSTNGVTQYDPNIVLYAQDDALFYDLHSVNGQSYAAAPQPWNEKPFLYGQVGMSVRLVSSTGPGYKIAFLLWPATNKWSNEVDFPEVDPDFTAPVRAASLNYSPNGEGENGFSSEDNLNTGVYLSDNKYHTFLLTWTPGTITTSIDGKVVATFTGTAVPAQAMRLSLQAEGWINQGAVPTSTTDVLEVPWVYINTYN